MIRRSAVAWSVAFLIAARAEAQDPTRRSGTGIVVDTAGSALPYVNVLIGSNRLMTPDSGWFSIRAASRAGPADSDLRDHRTRGWPDGDDD
jgi:hypothetical protein